MEDVEETTITTESTHPQIVRKTKKVLVPQIKTESPQKVYETKKTIFRTYQLLWYILAIVEILLVFRFLFKAIAANPFSGFVNIVYTLTNPLVFPFQGIIHDYFYGTSQFEWAAAIAAVVYALLVLGIVYLFQMIKPVTPEEVNEKVDNP